MIRSRNMDLIGELLVSQEITYLLLRWLHLMLCLGFMLADIMPVGLRNELFA